MSPGANPEFSSLLQHCGAGVLIVDQDGRVKEANALIGSILGYPSSSLIGLAIQQVPFPPGIIPLVKQCRETREPIEAEISRTATGAGALVTTVAPIINGDPTAFKLLVVARDVTELRRLERVRRDFVANVSHEMRTPLASIRAMAETLQDGALQDASVADRFLSTINAEAQRLTRIAEDLLILANVESRQPEKRVFNLAELIAAIVARFRTQAEATALKLTFDVPVSLDVEASQDQVEQVLLNLVDNSVKYTPAGGSITITADTDKNYACVTVADTGIGIDAKHLPRLFERFYRVDKGRSRQSGGTGLGLSIVKHIVEAHSGEVTVSSTPGKGTEITFKLPLGSA